MSDKMTPSAADAERRIRWIGKGMYSVTVAFLVAAALATVMVWISLWSAPQKLDPIIRSQVLPGEVAYALTPTALVVGSILALAPIVAIEWGLWNAAQLFRAYAAGSVLTESAGRRLRHFGAALIALAVTTFLGRPIASFVLTMSNPPGDRHILFAADSNWLILIVAGAIVIGVGWGLVEAARIADENRSFV